MAVKCGAPILNLISKIGINPKYKKVILRFCKRFLEVNRKASNIATKAELGSFPLQISLNETSLKVLYLLK